ncbi:MAG: TetR/AcrR family transcriptional regulator [Caulobacteraceae bacterium]|nr:TetR/AcrR family transcriptional regulator [Caulobacteraceae bacterium]
MTRKPRADSLRNRERLLAAAKTAFGAHGAEAPLEDIARRAGLGIGTLYRHFPTRAAMVAAVYERETAQLADSADHLLATLQPDQALEAWLHLLVDYLATKRMLAPALTTAGEGVRIHSPATATLGGVLDRLIETARADGGIQPEIETADVGRLLAGLSQGTERQGWEDSARRLVGVIMSGIRRRAPASALPQD